MKVLSATAHGAIDYLSVIIFALAPTVAGFTGKQATICYLLAVVHFLLTAITRFPLGILKTVPFSLHGIVEIIVSILLVILPWIGGFSAGVNSRNFFVAMGIVIFLVWMLTDYRSGTAAPDRTAPR